VLRDYPRQPKVWMSLGHALKTANQNAGAIEAYRRCIALSPQFGEVWWSLANLKTLRFSADDIACMRTQLARDDLTNDDRFHFHFSLGKALEDAGDYADAFDHYARGNALRRKLIRYDADDNAAHVERSRRLFTREFFAAHAGTGCPAPDPIFIVGLPRSGSTLVEQILASHPMVEGTQELPDITMIARAVANRTSREAGTAYPRALEKYSSEELHALGVKYLEQTRIQRKTERPFFIDKMPNNFAHVGLIQLILPNAKIIDARRHPLGCCFSCFKQHFARGQSFTYDLAELGRYYRDYVELMAHFDAVLPGRVHRVFYERMVDETEGEVRRLLDYCGLPFDPAVLRFHENQRAVRTASSEQVRQPIFREGLDQWRHFAPWLGPLESALGDVLRAYPEVP
jgi:tetratricopeptide (TPR) repeat protein